MGPSTAIKFSDEEGAQAIIELQKMAGIVETLESARKGWAKLSDFEKEQTIWAYENFIGGSPKINNQKGTK